MSFLKKNALAILMASATLVGGLVGMKIETYTASLRIEKLEEDSKAREYLIRDFAVLTSQLETTKKLNTEQQIQIKEIKEKINSIEQGSKFTIAMLQELSKGIQELSNNTKALTEAVIRVDQKVKYLEQGK